MPLLTDTTLPRLLDYVFGNNAPPSVGTLYFALFTFMPDNTGGGDEVVGGNYSRVAVTNNSTNFPAASGGAKANGTAIVWPAPTAGWGTIVGWGIYDAPTGGNLLLFGQLYRSNSVVTQVVNLGDAVYYGIGQFQASFSLNNPFLPGYPSHFSSFLSNRLLDYLLGNTIPPSVGTLYFGIGTEPPFEVSGSGYARVAIANNSTNFPNTSGDNKTANVAITWPTATGAWTHGPGVMIMDASSGGNVLYHWIFSSGGVDLSTGDSVFYNIGDLSFTI